MVPKSLWGEVPLDAWYQNLTAVLRRCDAMLRMPGESGRADAEEAEMRRLGRPVFRHFADVVQWARNKPEVAT